MTSETASINRVALLLAALFGLLLAGTGALWAHYGTTVFFRGHSRRLDRLFRLST